MDENNKEQSEKFRGLHIDIETVSAGGHIQFAGRDAVLNINAGGDLSQSNEITITVGGVETTPQAQQQLESKIVEAEQRIEEELIDEDTKDALRHYLATIKKLMLGKKKPNLKILMDSVKSITKMGPFLTDSLLGIFGEPLGNAIIEQLGPTASTFFKAFHTKFGG